MKEHFGRQVIEAPRHGSSNPSAKVRHYGKIVQDAEGYDYDGVTRLPTSRKQLAFAKKLGGKDFTDKLGPIQKYLHSQCGRQWNDVYSELARNLGRAGSEGIRHIFTSHINVATQTWRGTDGNIYEDGKHGTHQVGTSYWSHYFYVEPETGILRTCAREKSRRTINRERKAAGLVLDAEYNWVPVFKFDISSNECIEKIDGIWYRIYSEIRPVTTYISNATGKPVTENRTFETKQQLSKKDLRKYSLKNQLHSS